MTHQTTDQCYCDVSEPPSIPPCRDFDDSDLGTCKNCGHEKACHEQR